MGKSHDPDVFALDRRDLLMAAAAAPAPSVAVAQTTTAVPSLAVPSLKVSFTVNGRSGNSN
jgi:hypothetical protein